MSEYLFVVSYNTTAYTARSNKIIAYPPIVIKTTESTSIGSDSLVKQE
jgi:hypothetical protein